MYLVTHTRVLIHISARLDLFLSHSIGDITSVKLESVAGDLSFFKKWGIYSVKMKVILWVEFEVIFRQKLAKQHHFRGWSHLCSEEYTR